jgi:hypothetical protein
MGGGAHGLQIFKYAHEGIKTDSYIDKRHRAYPTKWNRLKKKAGLMLM